MIPDIGLASGYQDITLMVRLSKNPRSYGKIFHIVQPNSLRLDYFFDWLNEQDLVAPDPIPFETWSSRCQQIVEREDQKKVLGMRPFFEKLEGGRPFETYFKRFEFETKNTKKQLKKARVLLKPKNDDWLTEVFKQALK